MACAQRPPGATFVISRTGVVNSLGAGRAPRLSAGMSCPPCLRPQVCQVMGAGSLVPAWVPCFMEASGCPSCSEPVDGLAAQVAQVSSKTGPRPELLPEALPAPPTVPAAHSPSPLCSGLAGSAHSHVLRALQPLARGHPVPCPSSLARLPCPPGLMSGVTPRPLPAHPSITIAHYGGPVVCEQVAAWLGHVDDGVDRRPRGGFSVRPARPPEGSQALGPSQHFLRGEASGQARAPCLPTAWTRQAWGGGCSPEKEILDEKLKQGWKFTGFQVVLTFHALPAVSQ